MSSSFNDDFDFDSTNNLEDLMKQYDEMYELEVNSKNDEVEKNTEVEETTDFDIPLFNLEEVMAEVNEESNVVDDNDFNKDELVHDYTTEIPVLFDELEGGFDLPDLKTEINDFEIEKNPKIEHRMQARDFHDFINELYNKYGEYYAIKMNNKEKEKYILLNSKAYDIPASRSEKTLLNMIEHDKLIIEENQAKINNLKASISEKIEYINLKINDFVNNYDISSESKKNIEDIKNQLAEVSAFPEDDVELLEKKFNYIDNLAYKMDELIQNADEIKKRQEEIIERRKEAIDNFKNYHLSLVDERGKYFYIGLTKEERNQYEDLYANAYEVQKEEAITMLEHLTLRAFFELREKEEKIEYKETLDLINKYFEAFNFANENNNYELMKLASNIIIDIYNRYVSRYGKELPEDLVSNIGNLATEVKNKKSLLEAKKQEEKERIRREYDRLSKELSERLEYYNKNRKKVSDELFKEYTEANKGYSLLNKKVVRQKDIDTMNKYIDMINNFERKASKDKEKVVLVSQLKENLKEINKKIDELFEIVTPYRKIYPTVNKEIEKVIIENDNLNSRKLVGRENIDDIINNKKKLLKYLEDTIKFIQIKEKKKNDKEIPKMLDSKGLYTQEYIDFMMISSNSPKHAESISEQLTNYNETKKKSNKASSGSKQFYTNSINHYGKKGVKLLKEVYARIEKANTKQKDEFNKLYKELSNISKNKAKDTENAKKQLEEMQKLIYSIEKLKDALK